MSAKGRAMSGRESVPFALWVAEIGADFERVELFADLAEALSAARDLAVPGRYVEMQIRRGRKVVRRLPVGETEAA